MLLLFSAAAALLAPLIRVPRVRAASHPDAHDMFHTSDRCVACYNNLRTRSGEDVSIGYQWAASVMANAGRDPYWQGSLRRETIDHPAASAAIQNECSTCHMPMQHLIDRAEGRETQVFSRLPLTAAHGRFTPASDGVSCSVCHQIEKQGLGTPQTFVGNVVVAAVTDRNHRPEYGPFVVDAGHQEIMRSSTQGFVPTYAAHIRDSGLCGSCHTLYTTARGADGKVIGRFPEQVPFQEWQHSDYYNRQSCQDCHMPVVKQPIAVTAIYGPLRDGMHRHAFVGGNFLLQHLLNQHRDELAVKALPQDLDAAVLRTKTFLQTQAAGLQLSRVAAASGQLAFDVTVENRTGHKLPTAYPSRRAWLHVIVRDASGRVIFESGHLNPDGSIAGNVNDADPLRFERHHPAITRPDQVEIFESILGDQQGHVTTGLINAVHYLKDNRILPSGFDKATAGPDIQAVGGAEADPEFTGGSSRIRYEVRTGRSTGPYTVETELWYQPIGYRWAHNLGACQAAEPQRFVHYYEQDSSQSAVVLAHAEERY
ncbi:MAG TPA: hypothetical protein VHU89_17580 [Acidobacteriaceae bacterium]|jgi:hypothetical protein|nr:hypothetical protein [Acidobacteriaceae bacterium]